MAFILRAEKSHVRYCLFFFFMSLIVQWYDRLGGVYINQGHDGFGLLTVVSIEGVCLFVELKVPTSFRLCH